MISANITGYRQVRAYLVGVPVKMRQALLDEITRQTVRVYRHLKEVKVKAHKRRMKMPERSYLRSALRELKPTIIAALQAAIRKGVAQ